MKWGFVWLTEGDEIEERNQRTREGSHKLLVRFSGHSKPSRPLCRERESSRPHKLHVVVLSGRWPGEEEDEEEVEDEEGGWCFHSAHGQIQYDNSMRSQENQENKCRCAVWPTLVTQRHRHVQLILNHPIVCVHPCYISRAIANAHCKSELRNSPCPGGSKLYMEDKLLQGHGLLRC